MVHLQEETTNCEKTVPRRERAVWRRDSSGEFHGGPAKPRVQLYVSKEEIFPVPLKKLDFTRSTHAILDVMQELRSDDHWNVDENRRLSDSWIVCTKFALLKKRITQRICCPEETDKSSDNNKTRSCVARSMDKSQQSCSKTGKQEWANQKPKLQNARRMRGINFYP